MDNPGDQNEKEIREGTAALQEIADEVSEGKVKKGDGQTASESDNADEEGTTREDHAEESAKTDVEGEENVPMGSLNQIPHQGGHRM